MIVGCVLRSGGEYRPEHVARLRDQVAEHLPGAQFVCLSDVDVPCERIPLRHDWPSWWSKMSLFAPWVGGDMLYLDLDSTVVGDLSDMAAAGRLTIMRDVYRPKGLQSSVMYLPESEREAVWEAWTADPAGWIEQYRVGGDQAFLERLWLGSVAIWQDTHPGQVVSFKVDVRPAGKIPPDARVVVFHGKPRPWQVSNIERRIAA